MEKLEEERSEEEIREAYIRAQFKDEEEYRLYKEVKRKEKKAKKERIGVVEIGEEELLKWINYEGGRILGIEIPIDKVGIIRIKVEHSMMPEMGKGYMIPFTSKH